MWDEPYILGLQQDRITVQTVEPPLFIQTLPDLIKARLMYRYNILYSFKIYILEI